MQLFYGPGRRPNYFEGWYFKQQKDGAVVALIPAFHRDGGRDWASLQVIAPRYSAFIPYPATAFTVDEQHGQIHLGQNRLGPGGASIYCRAAGMPVLGRLRYGPLTPPGYDIMGPFTHLPGMQCRHRVISLAHRVEGWLQIGSQRYCFDRGVGYIEGDRGGAFPQRYVWVQCLLPGASVMVSVASVPLGPGQFTGCIASIRTGGAEYRLASYLGARPLYVGDDGLLLSQGRWWLAIEHLGGDSQPLLAPQGGKMARTIREGACCRARVRFYNGRSLLIDTVTATASFEGCWAPSSIS